MGVRVILLVAFILRGKRGLISGQGPIGGDEGNDCCPFITVNVGGSHANLNGEYTLIDKAGSKPDVVCINGCIYTKDGSPSTDEYCFRVDSLAGADVKCPVGFGYFIFFN